MRKIKQLSNQYLLTFINLCGKLYCRVKLRIAQHINKKGFLPMKRIKTIETKNVAKTVKTGGCGECQTSCQSACKTSCGVANQKCENQNKNR